MKYYDDHFAANKTDFLFGDQPYTADFLIGGVYVNYITNPNVGYGKEKWEASVENYPHFKAYGERFAKLLATYLA